MATPMLLVLTAPRWVGAARMPRALALAGFEVTLLAPRGSLAEKSGYIAKIAYLPEEATPEAWVHAFAATAKASGARLIVPADDNAFRLVQLLVKSPPEGLQPALHQELAALIADSLGDPAYYAASVDPTSLPATAAAFGVGVPPHASVSGLAGAESFGAAHGYPILLKSRRSGKRATVDKASDLAAAIAAVSPDAAPERESPRDALLVQAHVRGLAQFYLAVAWKGEFLAGFGGEKVRDPAGGRAQPAVNRYYRSDPVRKIAAELARGFGISGFFSLDGVVAEGSGEFHLLEVNRRLTGGAHRGSVFGVDHCAALYAAIAGLPPPGRTDLDPGEEHVSVSFPQEWLRDPESRWLRDHPVDVPWDEPELFEAMLELQPSG